MSKNLEIKVKLKNAENAVKLAERFCKGKATQRFEQKQEDVYYMVKKGRLKLRIINGKTGNLIHYFRTDKTLKRISNYTIAETDTPKNLKKILNSLYKKLITVKKTRVVFITGNVRIHIDKVSGLGHYLEFEIIINSDKPAHTMMKKLIEHFGLDEKQFIKVSYSDLLLNKK